MTPPNLVRPAESPASGGAPTTLPGALGLLHPFPSALNAAAAAGFTVLAGGSGRTAGVVGLSMALLQTSIGAVNDLADQERDRVAHPSKPLVAGRIGRGAAGVYAIGAATAGFGLAASLGPLPLAVAGTGVAAGFAYDLWLSRTPWSWLPYAVGLPLVPAFGWAASRGRLPDGFTSLLALGTVAGAALAIANGLADYEADGRAGVAGPARALGRRRSERLLAALHGTLSLAVARVVLRRPGAPTAAAACAAVPLLALGAAASRSASAVTRERAWEVQAVAVCLLGLAWLAAAESESAAPAGRG